jgi:hypothetical protein
MSLPTPITIADEAALIKESLDGYVTSMGGVVEIVSSEKMFYRIDATDSQTPRVMVAYAGETARGSFSQKAPWHRVDRLWKIAVTRGRGFFAERGASLYEQGTQEVPLFDVLESIRDTFRNNQNISEETPGPDYTGIAPMSFGNLVIDGFVISATTANDIPSNLNL